MRSLTLAALGLLAASTASAQVLLNSNHHTDIGLAYTAAGGWDPHIHDDVTDTEYAPNQARFFVGPASLTTRPVSPAFAFVGVAANQPFYRLRETQQANMLYLGFGSDEVAAGTFASYANADPRVSQAPAEWLRVDLVSVNGPGVFSAWNSGDTDPVVWFSTADGISTADRFFMLPESDAHLNFGFSAAGVYDVTVRFSGYDGPGMTGLNQSDLATYTFEVSPVPEPASVALLGGAAFLGVRRFRKAQRS